MRVAVLSGVGRYADPWHDFLATSAAVVRALEPLGLDVAVVPLEPETVARHVPRADLVVVNAGGGDPDEPRETDGPGQKDESWEPAFQVLRDHRAARRPLLGLHTAANTLQGLDDWPHWLGGRWVPGRSMHPPLDEAAAQVGDPDHPVTAGLAPFTVVDERYCLLDRSSDAHVLLHHDHDGGPEPLVWVTEHEGARTVYDALGHDVRSYASPERADLLRREVRWLLHLAAPGPGSRPRTGEEKSG